MKVHLPYGRQGLEVELPAQARVLLPKRVPALARPEQAVREAPEQYVWFHRRWKTQPRPNA